MSMIFQEPMTSLNPVYTVGMQLAEVVRKHQDVTKREALDKAVEMLKIVRIPMSSTTLPKSISLSGPERSLIQRNVAPRREYSVRRLENRAKKIASTPAKKGG